MPLADWNNEITPLEQQPEPLMVPEISPTASDAAAAAFRQENDMVNMWTSLTRPQYDPDPNFDLLQHLKDNKPEELERGRGRMYIGARSAEQFEAVNQQIIKEEKDRRTLQDAGAAGVAYAIAAGVISPTTFIPLVGLGARGVRAAGQAAVIAGTTNAAQELAIHSNQRTRTLQESGLAVGAGVVLGGILGGAVGGFRSLSSTRRQFEADIVEDALPSTSVVRPLTTEGSTVGAASSKVVPKGTKGLLDTEIKFGKGKVSLEQMSPVTRQLNSVFSSARWAMSQLSDGAVALKGVDGKVVAPDGFVADRVAAWRGNLKDGLQSLDDAYARYIFDAGDGPRLARSTRASIRGLLNKDKLSQTEFYEEVSRAMREGEGYEGLTEVKDVAGQINKAVYEPMLKEQIRLGMLPEDIKTVGDAEYLNRVYNIPYIKAHEKELIDILAKHFADSQMDEFMRKATKAQTREATAQEDLADIQLSKKDSEKLAEDLQRELTRNAEQDEVVDVLDEIAALKEQAREIGDPTVEKELLQKASDLRTANRKEINKFTATNARIKKRLRNLNKTVQALEDTRAKKMDRIAMLEEQQLGALDRVARRRVTLQKAVDRLDDRKIKQEITRLRNAFSTTLSSLEKTEARLEKVYQSDEGDIGKLLGAEGIAKGKFEKLNSIVEKLDDQEELLTDQDYLLEVIEDTYDAYRIAVRDLNARKVARIARLEENIKSLDPKAAVARAERNVEQARTAKRDLADQFRERGFDEVDLDADVPTAKAEGARDLAKEVVGKIKGNPGARIVGQDIIQEARGPELARLLNIPSREIEPFLENNIEKLVRAYVRTVAPDIELMGRFGSVNGAPLFDSITDEFRVLIDAAESPEAKAKLVKDTRTELKAAKKAADQPEIDRLESRLDTLKKNLSADQLNAQYDSAFKDLQAVIGRLRHTWGIPADPSGFQARGVRIAQNINTLRFMGMVAVSSIPDIARGIQKYGPGRFYQSGLRPLFSGFKELNASVREAQLAGTALDIFLHTRMYEMMEMVDDFGTRSKFEQGLEFATSKIGVLGMFDYWNTYVKGLGAMMYNAEAIDAIQTLVKPLHKGAKTAKKATDFLARLNIDAPAAEDIMKLIEAGGGGEVRPKVWLPETDNWVGAAKAAGIPEARAEQLARLYRAAMVREVDSIVVTPGLERPLIMDGSLTGKLLFQFRSFAMSSTFKTLMAGLQERNANFMIGSGAAIGMGALSYYLWGVLSGRDTTKESPERWMDEAIDRSGLLGVFAEVRNVGSTIPGLNDYVMFSGQQTVRRGGAGAVDAIFGPSADLAKTFSAVVSGLDDPTVGTARQARKLMPYQNLWWARKHIYDNLVEGLDLPERRQQ